jgi:hypothetical protein
MDARLRNRDTAQPEWSEKVEVLAAHTLEKKLVTRNTGALAQYVKAARYLPMA